MEDVSLSETESRYFSDLFVCCDVEKTGKIPMMKAKELYRSANITDDVIDEIISLAGIPDTALHISRAQFYSCLKLIAAYQVGTVPLRQELIAATVLLPLPRFSWKESSNVNEHFLQYNQANGLSSIPPPPTADRRNSLPRRTEWHADAASTTSRRNPSIGERNQVDQDAAANSDVLSTDSEVEHTESSCGAEGSGGGELGGTGIGGGMGGGSGSSIGGIGDAGNSSRDTHRRRGSPEAWSTNSDSPTPTNSVAERPWAKETLWHCGLLGDEHRQLLGTEEESSDRHSSDDDNETDIETIYMITPEQREYYFKQFKAVQHDINGLLSGQVARVFFEKSRIPVEELRHIWQLCDVTRDGALSLAEFTAAMHLVVLRRNNIPLPAVLPTCLYPNVLVQHTTLSGCQLPSLSKEPPEADLLHLNDEDEEDNTDNTIVSSAAVNSNAPPVANSRANNEKNAMSLSTLSTSSQASSLNRQTVGNHMNTTLTPPPLPPSVRHRSDSNSPTVETGDTPPALPLAATTTAAAAAAAAAAAKSKDHSLWTTDVPPTQWTKFTESPTSNVSSPGLKPVNFDMQRTAQAVVSDPQILHPVALRVTPIDVIGPNASSSTSDIVSQSEGDAAAPTTESPTPQQQQQQQQQQQLVSMQNNDLRAIQRPQAKKLPAKNIGALPPPPQRDASGVNTTAGSTTLTADTSGGASGAGGDAANATSTAVAMQQQQQQQTALFNKKDPPPLPPPRPHRHGRSSSLDLNKFKMSGPSCGTQPEITAQASFDLQITTGFADFTNFADGPSTNLNDRNADQQQHSLPVQTLTAAAAAAAIPAPPTRLTLQSNHRVSAFEVYRKPNSSRNAQSPVTAMQQQQLLPFGALGAAAIGQHSTTTTTQSSSQIPGTTVAFPNADAYEKRVNAISETLKHVSFKHDTSNMTDVLRHLREQNNLLLRLCNDLSDELLMVQTRKDELRVKLGLLANATTSVNSQSQSTAGCNMPSKTQRTSSSISAPVTANVTGGSGSSGVHSNV